MKSMKLSEYFRVIKPTYAYLRLIPDTSIRNYNSSNIAKAISHMYRGILQSIRKEEKHFVFETQVKCSYFIDIRKTNVNFYFIVPVQYVSIAKNKVRETWSKVTIEEVNNIEPFGKDALKYALSYKKEDGLSLNVDRTSNEPLNSLLNVIDDMQDNDRIGIFYNFMPCSQLPWLKYYNETIDKCKHNKPVEREKMSGAYIAKSVLSIILDVVNAMLEVLNDFFGTPKKDTTQIDLLEAAAATLNNNIKLSPATIKKKDAIILDAQMMVVSDSLNATRKTNNAIAVCQGYKGIYEDNELVYKKIKNAWNVNDFKIAKAEINKMSINECNNLIQLPGRELLFEHKIIEMVDTFESEVPVQLRAGTKQIGINTYKGNKTDAYLTTDKDYKNLGVVIIGPTRSGKSTLLGNLSRNSVDAGECVIVIDYIENCVLSDDIKKSIPKDKILEIDLSDYKHLQGLGYNEAYIESDDPFLVYESAKKQASQLLSLVNSINIENSEFPPRMCKYLNAASLVVFISKGAIKDVFEVLQNHVVRHEYISRIPEPQAENLRDYVVSLEELDEWSKATKDEPSEIVGTHASYISGIIDRVDKLKSNTYMEFMLKKDCSSNVNLLDEINKNQAIFIKMPENMFSTADERDSMTLYWLTKVWMTAQARAWKIKDRYARKTVTIVLDEIAQLRGAEQYVGNKLDQTAKFGVKFVLSTMYINQLRIREKLRTANTSYILISGADKTNFKELHEEFEQFGYCLEDLMKLKRYHSLNYIKYEDGYTAFITKLPAPTY